MRLQQRDPSEKNAHLKLHHEVVWHAAAHHATPAHHGAGRRRCRRGIRVPHISQRERLAAAASTRYSLFSLFFEDSAFLPPLSSSRPHWDNFAASSLCVFRKVLETRARFTDQARPSDDAAARMRARYCMRRSHRTENTVSSSVNVFYTVLSQLCEREKQPVLRERRSRVSRASRASP